jgi:hypothetical protein
MFGLPSIFVLSIFMKIFLFVVQGLLPDNFREGVFLMACGGGLL